MEENEFAAVDPIEPTNRAIYGFNGVVDTVVFAPAARGYEKVTPAPVQTCVTNIRSNLKEPVRAAGHVLAGDASFAVNSVIRFTSNFVLGGLGCIDVASDGLDLAENDTDIGLGIRSTMDPSQEIYIVLPLLGPSTPIDLTGTALAQPLDPLEAESKNNHYYMKRDGNRLAANVVRVIDYRAELLPTTDFIADTALDPYVFVRDAYLEQRAALAEEIREQ